MITETLICHCSGVSLRSESFQTLMFGWTLQVLCEECPQKGTTLDLGAKWAQTNFPKIAVTNASLIVIYKLQAKP